MTFTDVVPTCPGRCCAVFYFPYTPAELAEQAQRDGNHFSDFEYIADMLIPLTVDEAGIRWSRLFSEAALPRSLTGPVEGVVDHLYTCRHWDEETRLCGAYESRPRMCSEYPYADACTHGCGYVAPPETVKRWVAKEFDWKVWRWSSAAGGYRSKSATKGEGWLPGHGWFWDGETLTPLAVPGFAWDHRHRRWVANA